MVGLVERVGRFRHRGRLHRGLLQSPEGRYRRQDSAPQYIHIAKLYEVAKYYTVFHGLGSLYAFTINSDVYNKMPEDIQDALNEEMSATAKSISEKYVNKFYELEPVLTELGVEYYYLPAAERDKWKAAGLSWDSGCAGQVRRCRCQSEANRRRS